MEKPKLIVFDLNKTLIEENSWESLNLAMGITKAEDDMLMKWGRKALFLMHKVRQLFVPCIVSDPIQREKIF